MKSVQKVSSHGLWKIDISWRKYKIQEALYIGQWCLSPLQSRHFGTSHSSPNHHQLTCCIFLNLTEGLKSLLFQRCFYFWKSQKLQGTKSVLQGGWVASVIWCFAKTPCMRCDAWAGVLSWWRCQSPVAQSCGLVNHLNSFRRGMFKFNAKLDCRFVAVLAQSFWMCQPHSTHDSMASTAPTG